MVAWIANNNGGGGSAALGRVWDVVQPPWSLASGRMQWSGGRIHSVLCYTRRSACTACCEEEEDVEVMFPTDVCRG